MGVHLEGYGAQRNRHRRSIFWWHRMVGCPAARSRLALTLAEREVICRGVTAHQSARSIAKLLGRSASTVSREMSDRYRTALRRRSL